MSHRPTDTLLAALARRRGTHPYPTLITRPTWWCECGRHLANEGGGIPAYCPVCLDERRRG